MKVPRPMVVAAPSMNLLIISSWQPHQPPAGLSATEVVSHWTVVFEEKGIPEARESSEYIVAHVLGAKTVKCSVVRRAGSGGREALGKGGLGQQPLPRVRGHRPA